MRSPSARRSYEDDFGREKRVDRDALGVIAKRVAANTEAEPHIAHEVFILDAKRSPERLGKHRE